jgi:hypothetical protein
MMGEEFELLQLSEDDGIALVALGQHVPGLGPDSPQYRVRVGPGRGLEDQVEPHQVGRAGPDLLDLPVSTRFKWWQ